MKADHLEVLVEEASMEAFLQALLPRLLAEGVTFRIYPHQGKRDLLTKLPARLRGYARWLPEDHRIVVVVDRDSDDCLELKRKLERAAAEAGLKTRSVATGFSWQVLNRIAVEELEAWYFGAWDAVRTAYPRVSRRVASKARFREPDAIAGGTWEAFEKILQTAGYFASGLPKISVARELGKLVDPRANTSHSFSKFYTGLAEMTIRGDQRS